MNNQAGKGDRPRNNFSQKFRKNWEDIFNKQETPEICEFKVGDIVLAFEDGPWISKGEESVVFEIHEGLIRVQLKAFKETTWAQPKYFKLKI